jgi:hypothetical protein
MSKKSIWVVGVATCFALYFFPNQDNFWAYVSVPYYLAVCSLFVAIWLSIQQGHQLINYMVIMDGYKQNILPLLFYASILMILFLFLPVHTTIFSCLFVCYRWREWSEYKGILFLQKEQSNKEK